MTFTICIIQSFVKTCNILQKYISCSLTPVKGYRCQSKIFVADTIEEALTHVYAIGSNGQQKIVLLENDLPDNY